jgi:hypothetical protein
VEEIQWLTAEGGEEAPPPPMPSRAGGGGRGAALVPEAATILRRASEVRESEAEMAAALEAALLRTPAVLDRDVAAFLARWVVTGGRVWCGGAGAGQEPAGVGMGNCRLQMLGKAVGTAAQAFTAPYLHSPPPPWPTPSATACPRCLQVCGTDGAQAACVCHPDGAPPGWVPRPGADLCVAPHLRALKGEWVPPTEPFHLCVGEACSSATARHPRDPSSLGQPLVTTLAYSFDYVCFPGLSLAPACLFCLCMYKTSSVAIWTNPLLGPDLAGGKNCVMGGGCREQTE